MSSFVMLDAAMWLKYRVA